MQLPPPFVVLIVDDSEADARMLTEILRHEEHPVDVHWAPDGPEALEFLLRPDKPDPSIVLLDINMPKMSGHEVLAKIRSHEALRNKIVVMFSSSNAPEDLLQAYRHNANGFVRKPHELSRYEEVARSVTRFWGRLNCAPYATA